MVASISIVALESNPAMEAIKNPPCRKIVLQTGNTPSFSAVPLLNSLYFLF